MVEGEPLPEEVASPCVGICRLDAADLCIGCGRTLGEISQWVRADPGRRLQIVRAAAARLAAQGAEKLEQPL